MAAGRGNRVVRTVRKPSVMTARSAPMRLPMSGPSSPSVLPGSTDTHRADVSRVLRTVVRGGHKSDRCCHVVRPD